jgi:hypothetical protein
MPDRSTVGIPAFQQRLQKETLVSTTYHISYLAPQSLKILKSIRKYGQYHRPIAQPLFLWPNEREQSWGGSNQQAADGDQMIQIIMEAGSAIWERKKHN